MTACDLLAGADPDDGAPDAAGSDLPAELLADLYDPRLVITDDYVGPDRRRMGRRELRAQRRRPQAGPVPGSEVLAGSESDRVGHPGTGLRPRHLVATAVLAAGLAAPVTLVIAHLT